MGYAEIRLGSSAVECRTYGAQISLPQYPSPFGLGSRLAAGPPGLDALLGRTCPSSEINPHPTRPRHRCSEVEMNQFGTSLAELSPGRSPGFARTLEKSRRGD